MDFSLALAQVQESGRMLDGFRAPLAAGVVALIVAWIFTPLVRKMAFRHGAVDDPKRDDRRIHKEPLPRWGGIAIYLGILISLAVILPMAFPVSTAFPIYLVAMLLIAGILIVVGALDDLFQYSAKIQLLVLLGAGVAIQFLFDDIGRVQISTLGVPFTSYYLDFKAWYLAVPITAIYIFVVTKTMDTIDGVDGLASGIAAISAATLSVMATYEGQPRVALIAAAIGGASLGFLRHNYNPAKIIMGTGGAYVLGFMLACLSIVGALKTAAAIAILIPILVFGVPIFDAMFVIIRRIMSGQPITQADKRHVHHTLLGRGLSQRQTVWVLYSVAATLCAVLLALVVTQHG